MDIIFVDSSVNRCVQDGSTDKCIFGLQQGKELGQTIFTLVAEEKGIWASIRRFFSSSTVNYNIRTIDAWLDPTRSQLKMRQSLPDENTPVLLEYNERFDKALEVRQSIKAICEKVQQKEVSSCWAVFKRSFSE